MEHELFRTNLEARVIEREGDQDFFIETYSYPLNLNLEVARMSRTQFPMSRAILVRTTPLSKWVTVHVLRDVDLFSSFANFELHLEAKKLSIQKEEGYITMQIESQSR